MHSDQGRASPTKLPISNHLLGKHPKFWPKVKFATNEQNDELSRHRFPTYWTLVIFHLEATCHQPTVKDHSLSLCPISDQKHATSMLNGVHITRE